MFDDHLIKDDERLENNVKSGGSTISTWVYKDKCIVVRRIEEDGNIGGYKILPHPYHAEEIKEKFSMGDFGNPDVYAAESKFSFGYHKGDKEFVEVFKKAKRGSKVVRTYKDGCKLAYEIDNYGNTHVWRWIIYNH